MRLLVHVLFSLFFMTALLQYFEWGFDLYRNGIISSPVWSELFGYPLPHHGYIGFLGVFLCYLALNFQDFKRFVRRSFG